MNNFKRRLNGVLTLLCFPLLCADPAPATNPPLSLQDCIDLALAQNLQHLRNQQNLERGLMRLREAQAPFELRADMDLTLPRYRETRDVFENEALLTRIRTEDTDFTYSGDLQLAQRVRHLGRFSINSRGSRRDFSSNLKEDFLDYYGDITFNYAREVFTDPAEELALLEAELNFASSHLLAARQRLEIEAQVINAYYDLVQSIRRLEIEAQRREQSRTSYELALRKFEIGLIAEVDALKLQVALLETEASYTAAATGIERRRDRLRQQLGMGLEEALEVVTAVDYQNYAISEARALELGLARHTDMRRSEIEERISALGLKITRQRSGPRATLSSSVKLGGRGPEVGAISRNLERNLWNVGIQVQMPLIDGGSRRSQLGRARINLEQSRLDREMRRRDITLQIKNVVRALAEEERQIELGKVRLEVAERTYAVQQRRFEMGQTQSQELLDAQIALTGARSSALNAVIGYQRQLVALRLATMAEVEEMVE